MTYHRWFLTHTQSPTYSKRSPFIISYLPLLPFFSPVLLSALSSSNSRRSWRNIHRTVLTRSASCKISAPLCSVPMVLHQIQLRASYTVQKAYNIINRTIGATLMTLFNPPGTIRLVLRRIQPCTTHNSKKPYNHIQKPYNHSTFRQPHSPMERMGIFLRQSTCHHPSNQPM